MSPVTSRGAPGHAALCPLSLPRLVPIHYSCPVVLSRSIRGELDYRSSKGEKNMNIRRIKTSTRVWLTACLMLAVILGSVWAGDLCGTRRGLPGHQPGR